MLRIQCFATDDVQAGLQDVLNDLENKPLAEAIWDTRRYWNEADGPQVFVFSDEATGQTLAVMVRGQEPEVCITTYPDGSVERHRIRYITDTDGIYERTEIEEVAA
jgi:hypothetical protein